METIVERAEFTADQFFDGDVHLCTQIASMALQLRDKGHGYPAELENEMVWAEILTKIADPLMAYAASPEREGGDVHAAAKAAIELFARWFTQFWD